LLYLIIIFLLFINLDRPTIRHGSLPFWQVTQNSHQSTRKDPTGKVPKKLQGWRKNIGPLKPVDLKQGDILNPISLII